MREYALKRIFAKDSDNNIGNGVKTEPALCSSENEVFYGNVRGNSGWRGRGGMRGGGGNYRGDAGVCSRGRGGRGNYRGRYIFIKTDFCFSICINNVMMHPKTSFT